jgi:YfiH family protein
MDGFVRAQWSVPTQIHAFSTTRRGRGVSMPPFDAFNLGDHVGDDPAAVAANRAALRDALSLPDEPLWLRQVHGTRVVDSDAIVDHDVPEGDAAITRRTGRVLAILTADCLPVLFAADDGSVLGAAHAGWRGLAAGVLEATVAAMQVDAGRLHAWIGPAIRQAAFEVGADVREAFIAHDRAAASAFVPSARASHFLCDLAALARQRLLHTGLTAIADCGLCTHVDAERFYSHRRDRRSGRMATLLWRSDDERPAG